ncbi:adenylate/guanylate cyclase domain-containing protein [Actinomycetospora termitidis]|uniref:Adenylate/guanylate cyclase domain-containing protein n=1 Tax=Actinomycetospora termitidis TaxID=3053470 RepID=A0ABT7MBM4_9PSEU|nr:adenylate/guanylate cyclase domain-containing protein [Actinomycetospora sp. Odt1-22]MDL5158043.1 adenylate/guanylate cyclase domain-containing protein [Actinomycetospora sp. Odt1-22]
MTDPSWADARREVEDFLIGGERTLTRGDVAEQAGVPAERTGRLWSALGFPRVPDDVEAFAGSDLDALKLLEDLVHQDAFDETEALTIARTLGQSMARLAEWQADLLRRVIVERGSGDDPAAVVAAVRTLAPLMEDLQAYTWRRHLLVTAGRMMSALATNDADGDGGHSTAAVGFADIVGFTSLSRRIDADELRALLERFEGVSNDVVSRSGGRVVKTLGDEVLFVCDDAPSACEIAFALHDEVPDSDDRIALRIGLAFGDVLPRYGDVYGPTVNIASRLTSHARPGTTLVDDEMTAAIRAADLDVDLRSVPPLHVRGYRHLKPHVVRRSS